MLSWWVFFYVTHWPWDHIGWCWPRVITFCNKAGTLSNSHVMSFLMAVMPASVIISCLLTKSNRLGVVTVEGVGKMGLCGGGEWRAKIGVGMMDEEVCSRCKEDWRKQGREGKEGKEGKRKCHQMTVCWSYWPVRGLEMWVEAHNLHE